MPDRTASGGQIHRCEEALQSLPDSPPHHQRHHRWKVCAAGRWKQIAAADAQMEKYWHVLRLHPVILTWKTSHPGRDHQGGWLWEFWRGGGGCQEDTGELEQEHEAEWRSVQASPTAHTVTRFSVALCFFVVRHCVKKKCHANIVCAFGMHS